MQEIIVAGLALVGTLTGAYLANRKSSVLVAYRLEQLEKKVDVNNGVIERTYELEKRADVTDEKIAVANNRLKDLEKRADMTDEKIAVANNRLKDLERVG